MSGLCSAASIFILLEACLTEKPLEVGRQIVRLVPQGRTVIDLFAGSGTFLLAAKEAGLNWTGCELNKRYHALASERLAA